MKKIKAFLMGVFLLMTPFSGFAGYAEKDGGARHEIIKQVIAPILVAHRICRDNRDCDLNDVIKADSRTGMAFYIYGISDRKLINELLVAITQASNQYPQNLQLSVDVFAHPHSERSVWKRPVAHLFIKGEK